MEGCMRRDGRKAERRTNGNWSTKKRAVESFSAGRRELRRATSQGEKITTKRFN